MFLQRFPINKIIKKRAKTLFLLNCLIKNVAKRKLLNKNVFATLFVKIIKKRLRKTFFFMNLLIKNVFATFSIKIIKKTLQNVFYLLNYLLKNVSQRSLMF